LARFAYAGPDGEMACYANVGLDPRDEIHATEIENSQSSRSSTKLTAIGVAPPPGAAPLLAVADKSRPINESGNPVQGTDLIPSPGESYNVVLPIAFQTDKADVYNKTTTLSDLKRYADVLKANPNLKLTVYGNTAYKTTDTKWKSGPAGSTAKDLMGERAKTVKGLFTDQGVKSSQIIMKEGKHNAAVSADAVITNTKTKE
jgi:outer membrane protein OmpA-like peptidoglycan-associated protein